MTGQEYWDLYLNADMGEVDPDVDGIIGFEEERQARKLIMIPSESMAPLAVRQALGSVFNNVYAEGYPPLRMTRDDEETILDVPHQLAYYRRYADRRFYKGVDYVHFVETLAQRRAAMCFANDRVDDKHLYANVQPLSGAAANLAVYDAVLDVGDTVMGMDLYQGGHLTHGSEFNFSGKRYHVVSYGVSEATGKLDYDQIRDLARRNLPKMMIAGFTSYPWAPDWAAFADIAHEVGAVLLADISHTAGLVAAGVFPSPVGYADVISFTTHKTLCGPRGAVIMTSDEEMANRIDMAVFPGEQGGPHTQKFAAMAVAFKIALGEPFKRLQRGIMENMQALSGALVSEGLKLAYGGSDSHLCMLDLNGVRSPTGNPLRGEPAVRILDLAGIVANKNTIPGDRMTSLAMGIRLGTPWLTQRGFGTEEMREVASLIALTLKNIHAFSYMGLSGELARGKIDLDVLNEVKLRVEALAAKGHAETPAQGYGYPHFYGVEGDGSGMNQVVTPRQAEQQGASEAPGDATLLFDVSDSGLLLVTGDRAVASLSQVLTSDVYALEPGACQPAFMLDEDARLIDDVCVMRAEPDERGRDHFYLRTHAAKNETVKAWLRGLGDGYVLFDREDVFAKVEGPIVVEDLAQADDDGLVALSLQGPLAEQIAGKLAVAGIQLFRDGGSHAEIVAPAAVAQEAYAALLKAGAVAAGRAMTREYREARGLPDTGNLESQDEEAGRPSALELFRGGQDARFALGKPYFVGHTSLESVRECPDMPEFHWEEPANAPLQRTPLYDWHKAHTKKIIPFAGWEMPVWYTGVLDEHNAVRHAAGLFDVAHMGVFDVTGPNAVEFLDLILTNYVRWYAPGESFYSYFLDQDGKVIDDLLVYRKGLEEFQIVVNASNADKDWAWMNAVNRGEVLLDRRRPDLKVQRPATLRNLKDQASGPDMRVDLALQGPASMRILQSMAGGTCLSDEIGRLKKTGVMQCVLGASTDGFDVVIARTGYTGEDVGYELFIHPDRAVAFWEALIEAGKPFGLQPCGLAARDSTRTEAGLPLYGHELAGPFGINPAGAGFPAYVKLHKPYFIGRAAFMQQEKVRTMQVARFRMNDRGRMPKTGDPVVSKKGQAIGWVTSAAVDLNGVIVGLAYIQGRAARVGEEIGIYNLPAKALVEKDNKAELQPGDKVALSDSATILPRFPDKVERQHWRAVEGGVVTAAAAVAS